MDTTATIVSAVALAVVIGIAGLAGCKSTPTSDQVYNTAYACGIAAGMVCDQIEKVDGVRDQVVEAVKRCSGAVPMPGGSFAEAWGYEAEVVTAKYIDLGKIDEAQAKLIVDCASLLGEGLDYGLSRFPESVRTNTELVEAAVKGGCAGFLVAFKPTDNAKCVTVSKQDLRDLRDQKAYDRLLKSASKKHKLGC